MKSRTMMIVGAGALVVGLSVVGGSVAWADAPSIEEPVADFGLPGSGAVPGLPSGGDRSSATSRDGDSYGDSSGDDRPARSGYERHYRPSDDVDHYGGPDDPYDLPGDADRHSDDSEDDPDAPADQDTD